MQGNIKGRTARDAPYLSLYYRKKCVPKQERPLVASYNGRNNSQGETPAEFVLI